MTNLQHAPLNQIHYQGVSAANSAYGNFASGNDARKSGNANSAGSHSAVHGTHLKPSPGPHSLSMNNQNRQSTSPISQTLPRSSQVAHSGLGNLANASSMSMSVKNSTTLAGGSGPKNYIASQGGNRAKKEHSLK